MQINKNSNYEIEDNLEIYQIISFENFKKIYADRCFRFTQIAKWRTTKNDPDEFVIDKIALKLVGEAEYATIGEMSKECYGSCWMPDKIIDDEIWSNFDNEHKSVRICTTVGHIKKIMARKLREKFQTVTNDKEAWRCSHFLRCDKVVYTNKEEFKNNIVNILSYSTMSLADMILSSAYVLDSGFSRENEIRFLYNNVCSIYELLPFPVEDPSDMIRLVQLDPNSSENFKKECRKFCEEQGVEVEG